MKIDRLTAALADKYRIERELGRGGMATVYLAQDLRHDRKVAIKVLKPELAAAIGHERFLREIRVTANLRHPHILPLYDSGEADSFLYYVMPYVEGETLRDHLYRTKQLTLDETLRITGEVADALAYAHAHGVIHRDIKPENILLENGHAVVADFGIARALHPAAGAALTETGMAIGTPAYMSPEQASGAPDLDGRTDCYALACVTFEMLAGQPPFVGPTAQSIVHQQLGAAPRLISELRSGIPLPVALTIQRALAKVPADRYATAEKFAAALRAQGPAPVFLTPRRIGVGLVAAAAITFVSWFGVHAELASSALDPDMIAVLPFRVGGLSVDYLRESMLDLLQARLGGATGPRTVEPRTLLAAWRRAVPGEQQDLSEEDSRALARRLGAGRVLLGSAIATPKELVLSGTLISVGNGRLLAHESVSGPADSIAMLVDRLTAALLIGDAGEAVEGRSGLAAVPLAALQDYLAGRKASRRGDFFGAMQLYQRAFTRDTTFATAALAMVSTNAFIGTVFHTEGFRVIPRVAQMRARLSPREFDHFLAIPMVGPNYPHPSTSAETIAQAEHAADQASDDPEQWLLVGQLLSLYGAAASEPDWAARAAEALDRAIALDSSFTLAIGCRLFVALQVHDTAAVTDLAKLYEQRVHAGYSDDMLLWAAARERGDSAEALRWRDRTEGLSHTDVMQKLIKITLHSATFAFPLDDARWAVAELQRRATTTDEHGAAALADLAVRFAEGGRIDGVAQLGMEYEGFGPGWAGDLIQLGAIDAAYRGMSGAVLAREAAGGYRLPTPHGDIRWPPVQLCYGQLYRIAGRDTAGTGEASRRLRLFAALDPPPVAPDEWEHLDHTLCSRLLELLTERPPAPGRPWPHLDTLDSLMKGGPAWFGGQIGTTPTAMANYTIARLREAQGNIPAALAAIRRREVDYFPAYLWSLPAFLRQEGRLAALAGDTAGALRAYDKYLTLRTDPDPPFRPQRDSVLTERANLTRSITP